MDLTIQTIGAIVLIIWTIAAVRASNGRRK